MEQYISGEKHKKLISTGAPKRHYGGPPVFIIAAILLLVIGFVVGMSFQKSHQNSVSNASSSNINSPGGNSISGRFSGRRGAIGQVTAVSDSSITVQDSRNGSSITLGINSSTQITNNGATVVASSIQVGDTVLVRTSPSDTKQATRITVNPTFGGPPPASSGSNTTNDGSSPALTN